jgi:hypothetical protein
MLKKMKEYPELNKERENRVTEEIPKDNSELDAETREEDEEEEEFDKERLQRNIDEEEFVKERLQRNIDEEEFVKERLQRNIDEGRLERYLVPNKEQTINYNNKLLSDTLSSEK